MSHSLDLKITNMEEYPNDTVSQILWSRNSKMFATACWDGYVRVYSVNDSGVGFLKLEFKIFLGQPVLTVAWDEQNNIIFAGLCDGRVQAIELGTGNNQTIMQLTTSIIKLFWESSYKYLITVPLSNCIIFSRFSPPTQQVITINQKIVAADFDYPYLVLGTNQQNMGIINVSNANLESPKLFDSPLDKYGKITTISVNASFHHIAVANFEGRACIFHFNKNTGMRQNNLVVFKSQFEKIKPSYISQQITKLFYTSTVHIHPITKNKILSCGGQQTLSIHDYYAKSQHRKFVYHSPVSQAKFSFDGNFIAYALGNVWQQGLNDLGLFQPRIFVHRVEKSDVGL